MLWYLMKTWAGGEENLVKEIRRTVPPYMYQDAFVLYNERNWRHQGRSVLHEEPLFKGYVFLTCRETEPLFRRLEQIPALSRLMAAGYLSIFPLMEKDVEFLKAISGPDHIVHASYVLRESEETSLYRVCGPLEYLLDGVEKIRFSNRLAKTHKTLWGEDMVLPLGILVNADVEELRFYNETAALSRLSSAVQYTLLEIGKDHDGKNVYRAGGPITLLPSGDESFRHTNENAPLRPAGTHRTAAAI